MKNNYFLFSVFVLVLLLVLIPSFLITPTKAYAVTSPALGDVDSFSIIGYSGITDAKPASTTITGDIGVRPTTGASITGLLCASMLGGGTVYTVDATGPACRAVNPALLLNAMNANTAAYGNLVLGDNLPSGCTIIPNELGGQTLPPGLYCTAGNMTLNGTLTLSGTTGVWIFQSPSSITTVGAAAKVVGGDPCNVWWHLPDQSTGAVIGSGSQMEGNLLALGAITFGEGASLNGRALSQTKNVTLNGNNIVRAVCAASATPTPTPTTIPSSSSSFGESASAPAAKVCPNLDCVTPLVIESRKVGANSLYLSWGPYTGISTFIVQYGFENGKWLFNTKVSGFSTTINDLPPNQPIWVLIEPTDDCSIGTCGEAKLIGGSSLSSTPGLPNTGFAPKANNFPWYLPAGIFAAIATLLLLMKRNHR